MNSSKIETFLLINSIKPKSKRYRHIFVESNKVINTGLSSFFIKKENGVLLKYVLGGRDFMEENKNGGKNGGKSHKSMAPIFSNRLERVHKLVIT